VTSKVTVKTPRKTPAKTMAGATDAAASKSPLVVFHRFIPTARLPTRADRSAAGSLPTRAFRFCEAVVTAAAFGYYLFPPIDFSLMWDGTRVQWTWAGEDNWYPLHSAQFPDFSAHFDQVAPEHIRGFAPPFLSALTEPGIVQVWSGMVARTRPGWSLLVRGPVNIPRTQHYEVFEGIIETDRWFGPVFNNFRITKTDTPIEFRTDMPFLQVIPVPRDVYAEATLRDYELVPELSQLTEADWRDYHHTVVRPNVQEQRPRGQYAVAARRRRAGDPTGEEG